MASQVELDNARLAYDDARNALVEQSWRWVRATIAERFGDDATFRVVRYWTDDGAAYGLHDVHAGDQIIADEDADALHDTVWGALHDALLLDPDNTIGIDLDDHSEVSKPIRASGGDSWRGTD